MIQLCLSNQNIYCFTDEGCQYVCSRKGLFLPPMSTPGAMSLFSAQTPWTAVNRFRLSLLSLKISSYLQAGVNRTLLKTFFENHPVFMRYQLYLTSTLTLIYRAWKFWQNWECNIRCHKNSQLDCSKHLSHFSLQSCSVFGSIPPVNDFVTYPPTPGISTNILPIWVSGSLHLQIVRFKRRRAEQGKYVYHRCGLAVKWCPWVARGRARASFLGRGNLFDFLWRETMVKRSG